MWGFNYTSTGLLRINKEGKDGTENRDGYLDQSQEHWGVLCDEDL